MPLTIRIHRRAALGDIAGVSFELQKGVPVDLHDPQSNQTPLMLAVSRSVPSLDLVKLLVERGASVNTSASDTPPPPAVLTLVESFLDNNPAGLDSDMLQVLKSTFAQSDRRTPVSENVLSLALRAGHPEIIRYLLQVGADPYYVAPGGYTAIIHAMFTSADAASLLSTIETLIACGVNLDAVTEYHESALSVASRTGHFAIVRRLLDAGADPAPLYWTPLIHAVVFGSPEDLQAQLQQKPDLSIRDRWDRTPWLLSLELQDIQKSQMLLAAGADRTDRGRGGKTALTYPLSRDHAAMLAWLIDQKFDIHATDDFPHTVIYEAAQQNASQCLRILLKAGARVDHPDPYERPMHVAANLDIVRILLQHGANLNDISSDNCAALAHLRSDGIFEASADDYRAGRQRRFGNANPEKMNLPFWKAMVESGANAHAARVQFEDLHDYSTPIWCFSRHGKSINFLPDGRIVQIAGEHEDFYDPDFCIYNDLFVHNPDGTFDIYGYPEQVFPPTDFHSVTQVGNSIYIIGSLGYAGHRQHGQTPVYRLDLINFKIEKLLTTGEAPGWIHAHRARLVSNGQIEIAAGKISVMSDDKEQMLENPNIHTLDLSTLQWQKRAHVPLDPEP